MMEAKGHGGQIRLEGDVITISRKGMMGFLTQGLKGDKEIGLEHISSVQFKSANSLVNGYIQFAFIGGSESKAGLLAATTDENTVMFTSHQQPQFEAMRDAIKARISELKANRSGASTSSSADEIAKFAKLRDDGLITNEEYEAKKRALLGT